MGEDKSLLPFANSPTLTHFQFQRLQKVFKNVYISCKDSTKFGINSNFILDSKNNLTYAPTAGFIASFKYLKEDSFFAISVDSPFISRKIIELLLASNNSQYDAIIARTPNGMQPLCGIYNRSLEAKFSTMQSTQNHKLGKLLKESNVLYIDFEDSYQFLNINKPEDYKKALTLV